MEAPIPALGKLIFLLILFAWFGCNPQPQSPDSGTRQEATNIAKSCMESVIAKDDSLGLVRNHNSESMPLSTTIQRYAEGLEAIDIQACPPDFAAAFEKHRQAWLQMVPFVEKYPNLRGEMHALFDQLEHGPDSAAFKPLLKNIWDTWGPIEEAMEGR